MSMLSLPSEIHARIVFRSSYTSKISQLLILNNITIFNWASLVAQVVKNLFAMQETWVRFQGQEDLLEKGMPGELHGERSLADYNPWGCKESDATGQLTLSFFTRTGFNRTGGRV